MKYTGIITKLEKDNVAPLVGAWIEISKLKFSSNSAKVAPLVGAWIEIISGQTVIKSKSGRSSRGSVD